MLRFALGTWLRFGKRASCDARGQERGAGEKASPLLSSAMLSGYPCLFSLRSSLGKYNSQGTVTSVILKLLVSCFYSGVSGLQKY